MIWGQNFDLFLDPEWPEIKATEALISYKTRKVAPVSF